MKIHSASNKKIFFKRITAVVLSFVVIFSGVTGVYLANKKDTADAVSATDFKDGNIISDSVFYNKNAMSAAQIQAFLNSLIPTCLTWNNTTFVDAGGTRVGPPFVCLNNYYENPTTGATSFENGGGAFAGGISAAQIIYNAAQDYGINPQVLLVMLKKESLGPLTSDNWPTKWQYRYAMGYACPDTGANNSANCNSEKAGFYKQINLAAWQFKYYKEHPNDYRYGLGWNSIQYSPNTACGTKRVYIENIATLSLYIYTPYVPNTAALVNYPGTASCGAYGNRNFFMFFSEWFGNTQSPGYDAISNKYADLGSDSSWLGSATSPIKSAGNGGLYQQFQSGKIYWQNNTGAWTVRSGAVDNYYASTNYESGYLGYPLSDEITIPEKGVYQKFERGTVYWSPVTSAWAIKYGAMFNRFSSLNYESSYLGFPLSGEIIAKNGVYQNFQGGRLYWRPGQPSMDISTNIATAYDAVNAENGYLGLPNQSMTCGIKDNGCWARFDGGKIYWSSKSGSYGIHAGAIDNKYAELGWESGKLGYPISNEVGTGTSCGIHKDIKQEFQEGTLYWSACTTPSVRVELKN